MYFEQAAPSSTCSLRIVFLEAPVMREIERTEQPSTNPETICVRFSMLNRFMIELCICSSKESTVFCEKQSVAARDQIGLFAKVSFGWQAESARFSYAVGVLREERTESEELAIPGPGITPVARGCAMDRQPHRIIPFHSETSRFAPAQSGVRDQKGLPMNNKPETDLVEIAEIVITLAARQAAMLKLLRQSGLEQKVIDDEIRAAEQRIQGIGVVGEVLAKRRLPPPGSLSSVLKNPR